MGVDSPDMFGARHRYGSGQVAPLGVTSCLHTYSIHMIIYTTDMDHINCRIESVYLLDSVNCSPTQNFPKHACAEIPRFSEMATVRGGEGRRCLLVLRPPGLWACA